MEKGELAFITTIKQKKCQGVAVNVNCLFIKKNHYERSVKCVLPMRSRSEQTSIGLLFFLFFSFLFLLLFFDTLVEV